MGRYTATATCDDQGDATQTWDADFAGKLVGVKVDYTGLTGGTTDVTLTEVAGLGRTLLTLANNETDGVYYPTIELTSNAGAGLTVYEFTYIESSDLLITVAGGDENGTVAVTLLIVEG